MEINPFLLVLCIFLVIVVGIYLVYSMLIYKKYSNFVSTILDDISQSIKTGGSIKVL